MVIEDKPPFPRHLTRNERQEEAHSLDLCSIHPCSMNSCIILIVAYTRCPSIRQMRWRWNRYPGVRGILVSPNAVE